MIKIIFFIFAAFALVALMLYFFAFDKGSMGSLATGKRLERVEASANYSKSKAKFVLLANWSFENPMTFSRLMSFFFSDSRLPKKPLPRGQVSAKDFSAVESLRFVWLGHSMILLELDGQRFLIDPVFHHASPSPLIVKRFSPSPLAREDLPSIDAVVISHDHYDHLEMSTVLFFKSRSTKFIVPLGVGAHLAGWGIPEERIIELDTWEHTKVGDVSVHLTPSQHFSGRSLNDRNKTLWGSWSLVGPHKKVFYSGDGGYNSHFKEIGERLGPFDLTFIENGAYDHAWPHVHMKPEDGVKAHLDVRGKYLFPVHWGAYDLAFHPWDEPAERIFNAAKSSNVDLITPKMGEVYSPEHGVGTVRWWKD